MNEAQMAGLKELVIKGPDPELHKVVRWRCVDLCEEIARRYSVTVTKGTMGKWLRKLKLTRLQPRPHHPKKVAEAQELRQPDQERTAWHDRRHADRDLVSR